MRTNVEREKFVLSNFAWEKDEGSRSEVYLCFIQRRVRIFLFLRQRSFPRHFRFMLLKCRISWHTSASKRDRNLWKRTNSRWSRIVVLYIFHITWRRNDLWNIYPARARTYSPEIVYFALTLFCPFFFSSLKIVVESIRTKDWYKEKITPTIRFVSFRNTVPLLSPKFLFLLFTSRSKWTNKDSFSSGKLQKFWK